MRLQAIQAGAYKAGPEGSSGIMHEAGYGLWQCRDGGDGRGMVAESPAPEVCEGGGRGGGPEEWSFR